MFKNAVSVRKIPSKSYAFVEFENFTSAEAVCKQSVHTPYVLSGAVLTVRWGKSLDEVESGIFILYYIDITIISKISMLHFIILFFYNMLLFYFTVFFYLFILVSYFTPLFLLIIQCSVLYYWETHFTHFILFVVSFFPLSYYRFFHSFLHSFCPLSYPFFLLF